jgi:hypothetical protein
MCIEVCTVKKRGDFGGDKIYSIPSTNLLNVSNCMAVYVYFNLKYIRELTALSDQVMFLQSLISDLTYCVKLLQRGEGSLGREGKRKGGN